MRLCLINPSNPLVSIVNARESRWNRFRVWKPLSLMVLAGLTPSPWEIEMVASNEHFYSLPRIRRRFWRNVWQRRQPLVSLAGNLSYRGNIGVDRAAYAGFKRDRGGAYAQWNGDLCHRDAVTSREPIPA
jgi:hypothetical protein